VIIDELVPLERVDALRQAVTAEPHGVSRSDVYEVMASADVVTQPCLRELHAALGAEPTLAAVRTITGKPVTKVELRSYLYLSGSYVLPHTDSGGNTGRLVAFALFLHPHGPFHGGEVELFDCDREDGDIVATRPAGRIDPRDNRLLLYDVSPFALHQVREVTAGGRCSLAGWFL
jgi:Rps23 Pro-64 3,4-dihydroxylase Tpa1-like proline 4-hydroxylase